MYLLKIVKAQPQPQQHLSRNTTKKFGETVITKNTPQFKLHEKTRKEQYLENKTC